MFSFVVEFDRHALTATTNVGIRALDAAKMNRAIHLSRPDPDADDLKLTGQKILESFAREERVIEFLSGKMSEIATNYSEYYRKQRIENFHGLRDFCKYASKPFIILFIGGKSCCAVAADSLVKSMGARNPDPAEYNDVLALCLARNFSGLPRESDRERTAEYHFLQKGREAGATVPAMQLIRDNLNDRDARHLLVATTAGSALQILEGDIRGQDRPLTVIHGSQFKDDQTPDYSYRILSQIILCMERGGFVVLRDLDIIYGSLYDMLNQNYTTVGGKRNCRVALGADSNPMCHVADDFRCIVIMDSSEVIHKDPPFLNRFEKQCISYEDILQDRPRTRELIEVLQKWVRDVSNVVDSATENNFLPEDAFLGYHDNTLPSLVLQIIGQAPRLDQWDRVTEEQCKKQLLWTAAEDTIVRIRATELEDKEHIATWCEDVYYAQQKHGGFAELLQHKLQSPDVQEDISVEDFEPEPEPELEPEPEPEPDLMKLHGVGESDTQCKGMKLVIMTFASVYENPAPIASEIGLNCKQNQLGAFKSEMEFVQQIDEFWKDDELNLYALQVNAATDAKHVMLAKSCLEEKWTEYHNKPGVKPKHVCIMVHVDREPKAAEASWQFNFLSGWDQVTLDSLAAREIDVRQHRTKGIEDALKLNHVEKVMREEISTCFYDIDYPAGSKAGQHIRAMVELISAEDDHAASFITNLKTRVIEWLSTITDSAWVLKLACNRRYLTESATLANAVVRHMRSKVREPLAMLLFKIEEMDTLRTYFHLAGAEQPQLTRMWLDLVCDADITDIVHLTEGETGRELLGYNLERALVFPFSKCFFQRAETFRDMFLRETRDLEQKYQSEEAAGEEEDEGEDLDESIEELGPKYCDAIKGRVPEMGEEWFVDNVATYFKDFCSLKNLGAGLPDHFEHLHRLFERHDGQVMQTPMAIHVCFWRRGREIEQELRMIATIAASVESIDEKRKVISSVLEQSESDSDQRLLKSVCTHYLDQVRKHKDISVADWHHAVYKIVSEFRSSNPLPVFQLLRLCEEFVRMMCIDRKRTQWPDELSFIVNASSAQDMSDFFSSKECFSRVWQLISGMEDADATAAKDLQQFRLEFASRSLSELQRLDSVDVGHIIRKLLMADPEASIELDPELIVESVELEFEPEPEPEAEPEMEPELDSSQTSDIQPPIFLNKVIGDFLQSEDISFVDVLVGDVLPTQRLVVLDECLAEAEKAARRADAFASTLVLDVVEDEFFADEMWISAEETANIEELVDLIQAAHAKFTPSALPLHRITATAFLRTVIRQLGVSIHSEQDSTVLRAINAILEQSDPMVQSLRIYYLKEYRKTHGFSIPDLQSRYTEDETQISRTPWLKEFEWSANTETDPGIGFNPFMCDNALFKPTHAGVRRLIDYEDTKSLETSVRKCKDGSASAVSHRVALLSAFAVCFLFPSTKRQLNTNEGRAAASLLEQASRTDGIYGALPQIFRDVMCQLLRGEVVSMFGAEPFRATSPSALRLQASVMLHVIIVVASMENSVLTTYACKPRVVHAHYILSMPESEEAIVMKALAKGDTNRIGEHTKYSRYQCPCGFKYMVGECGKTMQVSNCPSCKNPIGGQDHEALPGQTKLDTTPGAFGLAENEERGFLEAANDYRTVGMHMRSMLPTTACILDLVVHTCLGATQDLTGKDDVDVLVNGRVANIVKHCQDHVEACFKKLKTLLHDCSDEDTAICLHSIVMDLPSFCRGQERTLENPAKRRAWESDFQTQVVQPKIAANLATTVREFRALVLEVEEAVTKGAQGLELGVAEMDSPPPHRLPRFFRMRSTTSFDALMAQFTNDEAAIRQFPYLGLFFDFESKLSGISYRQTTSKDDGSEMSELMSNLFPLVQWTNLVSDRLGHRIDSDKAADMTVEQFLEEHFIGKEVSAAQQTFENFEQSWNALAKKRFLQDEEGRPLQLDCRPLQDNGVMAKMTKKSPIKLSCLDVKNVENAWVYLAIQKISRIQNDYLGEAMVQAAQPDCTGALCFYRRQEEGNTSDSTVGRSACDIQDAQKVLRGELVRYERRADTLIMYGENDLEYGRGLQLRYNYAKLEMLLAKNHLFGCVHIDTEVDSIVPFPFSDTSDIDAYGVLDDLANRVDQEPVPKSSITAILEHELMASDERKTKVLQSLLVVARSLTRQCSDGNAVDKDKTLVKHVQEWMKNQIDPVVLQIFEGTFINALPVANLVALHDDIESSMIQTLIDVGTQAKFKKELTPEAKKELDQAVGVDAEHGLASASDRELVNFNDLVRALRRFTVRYLSKDDICKPNVALAFELAKPSRWPSCAFKTLMDVALGDAANLGGGQVETHWSRWQEMVDPAFDERQQQSEHSPLCKGLLVEHTYEALEYLQQLATKHGAADSVDPGVSRTKAQMAQGRRRGRGRGRGARRDDFKD